MIDLRSNINREKIPKNENPRKLVNIVEEIFDFNKRQKGKRLPSDLACVGKVSDRKFFNRKVSDRTRLKLLITKQMPQRLPIALSQVKASNASENLLNGIRKIIYSLY